VLAPAGTPRDLVSKLHAEVVRASSHADMKALYARAGIEPVNSTPDELGTFMKSEIAKWGRVVKTARISID